VKIWQIDARVNAVGFVVSRARLLSLFTRLFLVEFFIVTAGTVSRVLQQRIRRMWYWFL